MLPYACKQSPAFAHDAPPTLLIAGCVVSRPAAAADAPAYPVKPIRLIVPFAPAGSADALARTLQPALSEALGQTLVIDNRPGASSTIGTEMAARAAPDGYTLALVTTTHAINPSLIAKLPYDTLKDFAAVSLVVSQPNILVVHPSVAAKSVAELVALAKAKPEYAEFRVRRQRQFAAPVGRAVQARRRHPDHAHSVQGLGARRHRSSGRTRAIDVRRAAGARTAYQERPAARAGGRRPAALCGIAGSADHDRSRLCRG